MAGSHGEGRHTTLDKDLKRSVNWLHLQTGVRRIILGPIAVCKHAFTPGTVRVIREMPGGLELRGYFGVGLRPLYLYHQPDLATYLTGRIQDKFYPRARFAHKKMDLLLNPEHEAARDQDFDKGLKANGFTWIGPPPAPRSIETAPVQAAPIIATTDRPPVAAVTEKAVDMTKNRNYLTTVQAAKRLGSSPSYITNLVRDGKIKDVLRVGDGPRAMILLPIEAITDALKPQPGRGPGKALQKVNGKGVTGLATSDRRALTQLNSNIERLSTLLDMVIDQQTKPQAVGRAAETLQG